MKDTAKGPKTFGLQVKQTPIIKKWEKNKSCSDSVIGCKARHCGYEARKNQCLQSKHYADNTTVL